MSYTELDVETLAHELHDLVCSRRCVYSLDGYRQWARDLLDGTRPVTEVLADIREEAQPTRAGRRRWNRPGGTPMERPPFTVTVKVEARTDSHPGYSDGDTVVELTAKARTTDGVVSALLQMAEAAVADLGADRLRELFDAAEKEERDDGDLTNPDPIPG